MTGLEKLCKVYGSIEIHGELWLWNYSKNKAVLKSEITKEEFRESEKAKWGYIDSGHSSKKISSSSK